MTYKLPTKWSAQQSAFIDWAVKGKGSGVVEAVAGSGKTTTLLGAILGIVAKGQTVCFLVFNKKNALETQTKFADLGIKFPNECSTVHSAGFVHPCKFWKYDVVIIDEAQDTNDCRREIAKRLMKP